MYEATPPSRVTHVMYGVTQVYLGSEVFMGREKIALE
jgi:hypothetical protein